MTSRIGLIGVGEIARALVEGLSSGRQAAPPIVLSPRNASISADLAIQFANVRVASDNQDVADSTDIVVVAVRPEHRVEALSGLRLNPNQLMISAMAGIDHDELVRLVGASIPIVRAIPLPPIRHRSSVTVTYPTHPMSTALFDQLGGTLAVDNEGAFSALSAVTGTFSSYLHYLSTLASWAAHHDVPAAQAEHFVRAVFSNLGPALLERDRPLEQLTRDHETPGGINEQLRRSWFSDDNTTALVSSLDALLERVTARK